MLSQFRCWQQNTESDVSGSHEQWPQSTFLADQLSSTAPLAAPVNTSPVPSRPSLLLSGCLSQVKYTCSSATLLHPCLLHTVILAYSRKISGWLLLFIPCQQTGHRSITWNWQRCYLKQHEKGTGRSGAQLVPTSELWPVTEIIRPWIPPLKTWVDINSVLTIKLWLFGTLELINSPWHWSITTRNIHPC